MQVTITKVFPLPDGIDPEDYFVECITSKNSVALFWGSVEEGCRNIRSISHQDLPFTLEILDLELCCLDEEDHERAYWCKRKNATYSISESARIIVLPES